MPTAASLWNSLREAYPEGARLVGMIGETRVKIEGRPDPTGHWEVEVWTATPSQVAARMASAVWSVEELPPVDLEGAKVFRLA